jgi:hypothetical protein
MKDSDCFFISLKAFSTSISEITAKDPLPEGLQRRPSRGGSFPKKKKNPLPESFKMISSPFYNSRKALSLMTQISQGNSIYHSDA